MRIYRIGISTGQKGVYPMNIEPLLLTLLFAVAATAAIGAINARDTVRMVVNALLAMFCLAAAVYHTSRFLTLKEVPPPPPPPIVVPEPPKPPPPPPPPDTVGHGAAKHEALMAQGRTLLRGVFSKAEKLQSNLAAFDLSRVSDVSDEEYSNMQGRAQSYSAEARKLKETLEETVNQLPPGLENASEAISTAIEALAASASNLERFFKSENDSEEQGRSANFRRGVQAAESALRKAEIRLGPPQS